MRRKRKKRRGRTKFGEAAKVISASDLISIQLDQLNLLKSKFTVRRCKSGEEEKFYNKYNHVMKSNTSSKFSASPVSFKRMLLFATLFLASIFISLAVINCVDVGNCDEQQQNCALSGNYSAEGDKIKLAQKSESSKVFQKLDTMRRKGEEKDDKEVNKALPFTTRTIRELGQAHLTPLVVTKAGQRVELACHAFGQPISLTKDQKWTTTGSGFHFDADIGAQMTAEAGAGNDGEDIEGQLEEVDSDKRRSMVTASALSGQLRSKEISQEKLTSSNHQSEVATNLEGDVNHKRLLADTIRGRRFVASSAHRSSRRNAKRLDEEEDLVSLVFWYKDDNPTPIYTLDARQVRLSSESMWSRNSSSSGGRRQPARVTTWRHATDKSALKREPAILVAENNNHYGPTNSGHHFEERDSIEESSSSSSSIESVGESTMWQRNRQLLALAKHYPAMLADSPSDDRSPAGRDEREKWKNQLSASSSEFPILKLIIDKTSAHHSGKYKCRIDFRRSRTISQTVELLVEVPISRLEVGLKEQGKESTTISGQYSSGISGGIPPVWLPVGSAGVILNEGASVEFLCLAFGGSPKPNLRWLLRLEKPNSGSGSITLGGIAHAFALSPSELSQLDGNWSSEAGKRSESVEVSAGSRLRVSSLERPLHMAELACRANQPTTTTTSTLANYASSEQRQSFEILASQEEQIASDNSRSSHTSEHKTNSQSNHHTSGQRQSIAVSGSKESTANSKMIDELEIKNNELTSWSKLRLNLRPQRIEIVALAGGQLERIEASSGGGKQNYVIELNELSGLKLECISSGAWPRARLEWRWTSGKEATEPLVVLPSVQTISNSSSAGELEESRLKFELTKVEWRHHLRELTCVSKNERLAESGQMLGSVRLLVKFKPVVRLLQLTSQPRGANFSGRVTRTLECRVESNPPINQLVWFLVKRSANKEQELALAKVVGLKTKQTTDSQLTKRKLNSTIQMDNSSKYPTFFSSLVLPDAAAASADDDDVTLAGDKVEQTGASRVSLANAAVVPLNSLAADENQYKFIADQLIIFGDTNNDDDQEEVDDEDDEEEANKQLSTLVEYKCLASNDLGQTNSERVRPTTNEHRPFCSAHKSKQKIALIDSELELAEVTRISDFDELELDEMLAECRVEAKPAANKFIWSFLAHEHLLRALINIQQQTSGSNPIAAEALNNNVIIKQNKLTNRKMIILLERDPHSVQWESKSSQLSRRNFKSNFANYSTTGGLLMCKAANEIGLQRAPACASLLLTKELDTLEPDASNCTVEPLIEPSLPVAGGNNKIGAGSQNVAVSIDCSKAQKSDKLLFQLTVERRGADLSDGSGTGRDQTQVATSSSSSSSSFERDQTLAQKGRRLLFAENGNRRQQLQATKRIPISQLINLNLQQQQQQQADQQTHHQLETFYSRQANRFSFSTPEPNNLTQEQKQEALTTLEEQVQLLNELVFSVRASNLIKTSASHAIYGSQLQLRLFEQEFPLSSADSTSDESKGKKLNHSTNFSSAQVSRSTNQEQLTSSEQSIEQQNNQVVANRARINLTKHHQQEHNFLADWIQHNELSITICAIGATLILSGLTLTLILVVLRSRKEAREAALAGTSAGFQLAPCGPLKMVDHSTGGGSGQHATVKSFPVNPYVKLKQVEEEEEEEEEEVEKNWNGETIGRQDSSYVCGSTRAPALQSWHEFSFSTDTSSIRTQQPQHHQQQHETIMTLDEQQVNLLNELVFALPSGNIIQSAPHAIYGSQLELHLVELNSEQEAHQHRTEKDEGQRKEKEKELKMHSLASPIDFGYAQKYSPAPSCSSTTSATVCQVSLGANHQDHSSPAFVLDLVEPRTNQLGCGMIPLESSVNFQQKQQKKHQLSNEQQVLLEQQAMMLDLVPCVHHQANQYLSSVEASSSIGSSEEERSDGTSLTQRADNQPQHHHHHHHHHVQQQQQLVWPARSSRVLATTTTTTTSDDRSKKTLAPLASSLGRDDGF